jgi:hypothetical protein
MQRTKKNVEKKQKKQPFILSRMPVMVLRSALLLYACTEHTIVHEAVRMVDPSELITKAKSQLLNSVRTVIPFKNLLSRYTF